MAKAIYFMKKRDVEKTISIMKSFVNTNKKLISLVSNKFRFCILWNGISRIRINKRIWRLRISALKTRLLLKMDNIHFRKEDYVKAKEYF